MPKVILKFNAAVLKEILLQKDSLTVGRKPDNDVVIDNPAVSSHHCRILLQGGTFFVEDLDSTNGTYLNEKRIMKAGLHHNDVVGLASKHALVFIEDNPPPPPAAAPAVVAAAEKTVVLGAAQREELSKAALASSAAQNARVGSLRVLKGEVSQREFDLAGLSTYIGKSDRVQVPIKGAGLFGSAPEVAASIHRKPEGYVLVAVEKDYPSVNGAKVASQVLLKDGDLIVCGGTTMQFVLKDK